MSMLAEPRRKQKWTLNPRGKFWSDDKNKFGQRMLERMGWTEGKGLGVKEQGATSHVAVRFKNDSKGLGAHNKDGDWCRHQEEFESLLANLNENADAEASAASIKSLEEISKNSRKRLHYAKFTRGKDLSLYSQKDLDCILGKGTRKEEVPMEGGSKEDYGTVDNLYGVTTIVRGSVTDYFRKKMKSLTQASIEDDEFDEGHESSVRIRKVNFGDEDVIDLSVDNQIMDGKSGDVGNQSKRKKKIKYKKENIESVIVDQSTNHEKNDLAPLGLNEDVEILGMPKEDTRFREKVFENSVEEEIKVLKDSYWKVSKKKKNKGIFLDDLEAGRKCVIEKGKKKGSKCASGKETEIVQSQYCQETVTNEDSQSIGSLKKDRSLAGRECVVNSEEDIQVVSEGIPEICKEIVEYIKLNIPYNAAGLAALRKKDRKKRKKDADSEDVICLGEVLTIQDDSSNNPRANGQDTNIKRKKLKTEVPSRIDSLGNSDDTPDVVEIVDSERSENFARSSLEVEIVDICESNEKMKRKKSSKECKKIGNKSLVTEINQCGEIIPKNGVEMLEERVKVTGKGILDPSGMVLNSHSAVTNVEDSLASQVSEKSNSENINDKRRPGLGPADMEKYFLEAKCHYLEQKLESLMCIMKEHNRWAGEHSFPMVDEQPLPKLDSSSQPQLADELMKFKELVQRLYSLYKRSERNRKALTWQKQYFLSILNTSKIVTNDRTLDFLKSSDITGLERLHYFSLQSAQKQKSHGSFRALVWTVIATVRMRVLMLRSIAGIQVGYQSLIENMLPTHSSSQNKH